MLLLRSDIELNTFVKANTSSCPSAIASPPVLPAASANVAASNSDTGVSITTATWVSTKRNPKHQICPKSKANIRFPSFPFITHSS